MNKIALILIVGILLRILIAASTYHPDLQTFNLAGQIVASGHVLDIYDYLQNLPDSHEWKNLALFNYPPAIYIFHGSFNFIFSSIFYLWQVNYFLMDVITNYGNINFNLHLLLLKIPYLIFDLLAAFFIIKLFDNKKDKLIAFGLWMFNPINLYATYMMGQFDIIPTSLMVLALVFASKNKLPTAAFFLGFGIAFKVFPIFLLPIFILMTNRWLDRAKIGLIAFIPYLISVVPFISSSGFRTNALFADQGSKSLYSTLAVSGGERIFLFPLFLLAFYLILLKKGVNKEVLNSKSLIAFLLFFIFTHFHPQWLLWITPFLIICLVREKTKNLIQILILLISYLISLFFFESSLTVNLFAPLLPFLKNLPGIWEILNINIDINYSRSITQTIFAAASLYLIYIHFPSKDAKD
ncbi:DUF2029 domain-containing protein [Candidatus Daviesbacteria bacterium]|nr:DUF2029 domain-containing protein [Candidatus Daviesbacteria bacterium]